MKLFLIILGINILIFLIVFVFCACKVASLCDKEMEKINKDISEVNSMLTIMEIEGTIEQVPGNYYVRAGKKIS